MNHVLVAVAEGEGIRHNVGGHRTRRGVDLALIQADLPGGLRHFFAGFSVNAGVHAFTAGEPVVGGGDEHVTVVVPWFATNHAKDAMPASSRHVEFGHGRPKRHEYI